MGHRMYGIRIFGSYSVSCTYIYASAMKGSACDCTYLRAIAFDHSWLTFFNKTFCKFHAERATGDPYQVDHRGSFCIFSIFHSFDGFSCQKHGLSPCICNISKADGKGSCAGRNVRHFCRMFCHNRASSKGQNCVGTVVDHNGMCDAVDQRCLVMKLVTNLF